MTDLSCKISFRSFFSLFVETLIPSGGKNRDWTVRKTKQNWNTKKFLLKAFLLAFPASSARVAAKTTINGLRAEKRVCVRGCWMDVLRCFRSVSALRRVCVLLGRRRSSKNAKFLSLFVRRFIADSRAMLFEKALLGSFFYCDWYLTNICS